MDKKLLKKRLDKISFGILILYFGCYIILSALGNYDVQLDASGNSKLFDRGWNLPDTQIWQPKYLMLRSNNWNYGGLFYSPMILLDRLVWHKSVFAPH